MLKDEADDIRFYQNEWISSRGVPSNDFHQGTTQQHSEIFLESTVSLLSVRNQSKSTSCISLVSDIKPNVFSQVTLTERLSW